MMNACETNIYTQTQRVHMIVLSLQEGGHIMGAVTDGYTSTGAILVLFILLVIITLAFVY